MEYNKSGALMISSSKYNSSYRGKADEPGLPIIPLRLVFKKGVTYKDMSFSTDSRLVMEEVDVAPNPLPSTSGSNSNTTSQVENTNYLNQTYPSSCATYIGTGIIQDYAILQFMIYPFEYDAQTKKLYFHDSFDFVIDIKTPTQSSGHRWFMADMNNSDVHPNIHEYYSVPEIGENGIEYFRIFDESYLYRSPRYSTDKTILLPYGYRLADKQIYIYDYDQKQETLAFDFNLAVGDHFTTFNGMKWEVESVKDTLVNISYFGYGESVSKRLLTVKSLDGTLTDQWLEDFGSFTNHLMINSLYNVKCSQTLWMEYNCGEYFAREISTGPILGHDSGYMDERYAIDSNTGNQSKCYYENGQLVFENIQLCREQRIYYCFYRDGDNISKVYEWRLHPDIILSSFLATIFNRKDVITFQGLPEPTSGKYTLHMDDEEYSTVINNVRISSQSEGKMYDIQGRKLSSEPSQGLYIKDGQKVYKK